MPTAEDNSWRDATMFVADAHPDPREAFERQSLERTIRVLEKKRLTDKEPTFVGTWDVNNPSKGYFELFIDESNGRFQGEVIDCSGDADVEGTRTETELRFMKRYRKDACSTQAYDDEILYRGLIKENEVIGFYAMNDYGEAMYMTSKKQATPLQLGMSWIETAKKYKSEIKDFGKRFFK